jgi:hypothetical protein
MTNFIFTLMAKPNCRDTHILVTIIRKIQIQHKFTMTNIETQDKQTILTN